MAVGASVAGSLRCGAGFAFALIPEVRPLSKTDPESVIAVTKWLDSHTKPAGHGHTVAQPINGTARKRRVTV